MDMPHSALSDEHWLTIWSYVPADFFSVPVVSVEWKKTWAASWQTLSSLRLDFRNPRLRDGDARAVARGRWSAVAYLLPGTLNSLSLDFRGCRIWLHGRLL